MKEMLILPKSVNKVLSTLNESRYQSFVVGGCVRDMLLEKIPNDYDVCTDATPSEMKYIFLKNKMKTYDTGIQHGTISVSCDNELYEVTTYRIDGEYSDGRHPNKVSFTKNITEDLARRDFTINAMAYNRKEGLVDPLGGKADIKNGVIRCVGNPTDRFHEDALRILRAIRFAVRLNFNIEENTSKSLIMNRKLLTNVSAERKADELIKILMDLNHENMHLMFKYRDVFAEVIPELREMFDFNQRTELHDWNVYEHSVRTVVNSEKDEKIRLASLLHDIAKPKVVIVDENNHGHYLNHAAVGAEMSKSILKNLKMDNATIDSVSKMIMYHNPKENLCRSNLKRWMRDLGVDETRRCLKLIYADTVSKKLKEKMKEPVDELDALLCPECYLKKYAKEVQEAFDNIDDILDKKECFNLKGLAINGKDLVDEGLKPGKEMGEVLNFLLERVIVKPELNNKEFLLNLAKIRYEMIRERENGE